MPRSVTAALTKALAKGPGYKSDGPIVMNGLLVKKNASLPGGTQGGFGASHCQAIADLGAIRHRPHLRAVGGKRAGNKGSKKIQDANRPR